MKLDIYFKNGQYDFKSIIPEDEESVIVDWADLYSLSGDELRNQIPFYDEQDLNNNFEFVLIDGKLSFKRRFTFDKLIADKINYRIKNPPYFNLIALPKISSPATQEEYFSILKLVEDLDNKDSDLAKLCAWKIDLIGKMSNFYRVDARVMQIKNGAEQIVIVNQDFANNLASAILQAKATNGVYTHRITDENGKFTIIDGKPKIIKMSLKALEYIAQQVELRRGYCACAERFHVTNIMNLNDVSGYDYMTDDSGVKYEPASPIFLNDEGDLVDVRHD